MTNQASAFSATLEANGVRRDMLNREMAKAEPLDQAARDVNARIAAATANIFGGFSSSHPYQTTFENEASRVMGFVNEQQVGIEIHAKELFRQANVLATSKVANVQESYASVQDLRQAIRKIADDSILLQDFFSNARTVLLDHAKMADDKLRDAVHCSQTVQEIMPKAHLNSALVCVVSDTYQALRVAEEKITHGSAGDAVWEAPSSFKRSTTKYWVKDENLTKLMMINSAEAPLLVYGKKGPLTSLSSSDLKSSDGDKLWDSLATVITSIYFDSDDMAMYKERIKRAEGAQLLRARWYGNKMPTGEKPVFLELKTHHEKWVAQKSVKERATIQAQDMVSFLRPLAWDSSYAETLILKAQPKLKKNADGLAEQVGLLMRMHNLVVKHNLTACVRTCYDRAAFQSSKSNDLRLTLDRNVTVVNEREQRPIAGHWCLDDMAAKHAQACVVPFNVFEVKLAGNDPMPPGLAAAEADETMILAAKFSKFLTGAAAFNAVPILPYWAAHPAFYSFFGLDKHSQKDSNSDNDSSSGGMYNLMENASNVVTGILRIPTGVVIAPKNPARIEPKTYFANERTFVQWVSASILLLNISGFMLEAGAVGDYNTTAAVISMSALVLVVYSSFLYFKRLNLLKEHHPYGYFNKVNPLFLTTICVIAILMVWAGAVEMEDWFSFENRRMLRGQSSGRHLQESMVRCPQEVTRLSLNIGNVPNSFIVDHKSHSFLMTNGESVFVKSMDDNASHEKSFIRIEDSRLKGLASVGDRLFTVSDGPKRTELIEMALLGKNKLQVVGRWTIVDRESHIDGFSFVSGNFYINSNSSIHLYSMPDGSNRPMRLKSLNMKAFAQQNDHLSMMTTFEGITYLLEPERNVLKAWNLTEGAMLAKIELPTIDDGMIQWTGFALERKEGANSAAAAVLGGASSAALVLHLMTVDGHIWSFPSVEDTQLFSMPTCQIESSLN